MAKKKKSSRKRKASSTPKRKVSTAKKPQRAKQTQKKLADVSRKIKAQALPKPAPKPVPLKPAPAKPVKPSVPKKAYDRTKTFKRFNKRFLRKTDNEYKNDIKKFWKLQYEKGVPLKQITKQTKDRFVYDTHNRLYKSKKKYWGVTRSAKDKKGKWVRGKPKKRSMWRDRLTGRWLKHNQVFRGFLRTLETVHVRNYMKIHKMKSFQKARKKYLKEIKNMTLGQIVQLYGVYLH